MNALNFQRRGIDELISKFKELWNNPNETQIVFKSPTGSGKTFMTESFINELNSQPDWNEDIAFVWITFSDDLAMQSRDKFLHYFSGNLNNQLLTVQDFSQGILNRNDVLFINWQKLVSKKAENRILRRPDDARNEKENGFYFEDVIDATHKAGRRIILIIDESHKNVTDSANRDVISKLQCKMIIKVSATPFNSSAEEEKFYAEVGHKTAEIVEVKNEDVIAEGLIKSKIVCQTEEELLSHKSKNLDELMLDLAIERRNQIVEEWKNLNQNINPLILIQLPNDDEELKEQGVKTKEEVVRNSLKERNIPDERIATWLNGKSIDQEYITKNDCPIDFLIFKLAAGTGWDCPRAHILVMYREIKKAVFQTQILGRILRMPYIDSSFRNELLTTGYLYTNYKSNEVNLPNQDGKNLPKVFTTEISTEIKKTLAVENFSHQITELLNNVVKENPKLLDEKSKNKLVESIKAKIEPVIKETAFETDESKKDNLTYLKSKTEIENKFEEVKSSVAEILQTTIPTEMINETVEKTKSFVNEIKEIACNENEAEFILDPELKSDFLSRTDYGDIGKVSEFQKSFIQFMNEYFSIVDNSVMENNCTKLTSKGISLETKLSQEVMANAVYHSDEKTNNDDEGKSVNMEMSANDVDKNFTWKCYEILGEQTEEDAKIGNRARSWGPFKEALRQWFRKYALSEYSDDEAYRIFLNDTNKMQSVFKDAITFSLKKYRPVLNNFIKERETAESERLSIPYTIKSHYSYSNEYEIYTPSSRSMVQPFYLQKDYNGRENETAFIQYLETAQEVKSWFKNGDNGKEFFGIKYFSREQNCYRLFYPDWIVITIDGVIGIFDTKGGITASSQDTKDKAEELHRRIIELNEKSNHKYFGGIVVLDGGQWKINSSEKYFYVKGNLIGNGWKTLSWKPSE